ncbi:MAG TPA: hypothetical protein PLE19_05265 [Planctomycetota bacterium]|nr:hypothetical protein [Planctomycetota bacterium]HRR82114.1 hypothetical protein [Planctomycetota bacterium]HRT92891.1 hypothetical protein [Planctomycetota bacterium]
MPCVPRTFTFRACLIGIVAMVLMGLWIHYHEVLAPQPNILAENNPPASAVGVFLGVLLIGALVAACRRSLRLAAGELLVVYTMLVVSAPLMSQGMWHRFLGLVISIPDFQENMPLVDSYSDKLWPHGENLVANPRFEARHAKGWRAEPAHMEPVDVQVSPIGKTRGLRLVAQKEGDEAKLRMGLRLGGRAGALVPGERYYATALFKLSGFQSRSALAMELLTDAGERVPITTLRRDTPRAFSRPGGFLRAGEPHLTMPRSVRESAEIVFTLAGPGEAIIADVVFFSNEAVARLRKGVAEIRESDLARLPAHERGSLVVRPDSLASPAGVAYTLKGYIPYRQWLTPLAYWGSIVMAMFLALLGLGVIFRKQWSENERFSFPMVVLPRMLLEEREDGGRTIRPIWRRGAFRAGIVVALAFCLLQGLNYYIPGMPNPTVEVDLAQYFSSPEMKAFVNGFSGAQFKVILLFTAIAFFVDLDMLLSIVLFFWLSKVPYYFGELFGWKNFKGPMDNFPFPHEQHIGAFLSLALVVLWTSRRHLVSVGRRILGIGGGVDDSGEGMSYRAAAALVVGAFVFFGVWGAMTGLGAGSALLFFGFLVVCGLSASRIRTECGAPATYFTPYFPYLIFFLLGGLFTFGTPTMLLTFVAGGFMAVAQFLLFAPTQVEMLHLAETQKASPRGVRWALIVGALGGLLIGGYVMLVWAYGKGSDNIPYMKDWATGQNWYFTALRNATAEADAEVVAADKRGETPKPRYPTGPLIGVGVGTTITLLLAFLRTHFVGFWLHPIGYILANSYFCYMCWGSLFAAWVIKWVGLKIGGPRAVRENMTPFFGGIFVGCVVGMLFWDAVALVGQARGVTDVFTCFP